MSAILLLLCLLPISQAVIYTLNASDYAKMPQLLEFDSFESCHLDSNSLYCYVEAVLVSDSPSPLLDMIECSPTFYYMLSCLARSATSLTRSILRVVCAVFIIEVGMNNLTMTLIRCFKQFSAHTSTHYNHTRIRRGICVTQACKHFHQEIETDLRWTLERCINESLYSKYKLKAIVLENALNCNHDDEKAIELKKDTLFVVFAVVLAVIIVLNIAGSLYEAFYKGEAANRAVRFILFFSLQKNWRKLTAPTNEARDQHFKSLDGFRVITACIVVLSHSLIAIVYLAKNTDYVEQFFTVEKIRILFGIAIMMQTFMVMSSFLLVHDLLTTSERRQIGWMDLPKYILKRWLRLSKLNGFYIILIMAWFPRITSGPLKYKDVPRIMNYCYKNWWKHLLYFNNYVDSSQCFKEAGYLAADFQLYVFSVIVWMFCRSPRVGKVLLPALFVIGLIIPAVITYIQDLDGLVVASPEALMNKFNSDPSFNQLYITSHTNISGAVVGMVLGYLVYYMQKKKCDISKYKVYRLFYWMLFPLSLLCLYTTSIFYADSPRPSIFVRTMTAAFLNPSFAIITAGIMLGTFFKFENVYRRVLEWRGFSILSPLTFGLYLTNLNLIKIYIFNQTSTIQITFSFAILFMLSILVMSLAVSGLLWLLIEAPLSGVIKEFSWSPHKTGHTEKPNLEKTQKQKTS